MSVVRYDPFNALQRFRDEMQQVLSNTLPEGDVSSVATSQWVPAVDIKEEPSRFVLTADVPGVNAGDIDVTMENGLLTIKGERRWADEESREGYRRIERRYGSFYRRFSLPDSADAEKISARASNGVLEVVIPKREAVQPRRIEVAA